MIMPQVFYHVMELPGIRFYMHISQMLLTFRNYRRNLGHFSHVFLLLLKTYTQQTILFVFGSTLTLIIKILIQLLSCFTDMLNHAFVQSNYKMN